MKRITFVFFVSAAFLTGCATDVPRLHQPKSFVELRSAGNELQAHQYSCGAASLATLMTGLGRPTVEKELLDEILPQKGQKLVDNKNIEIEPLSIKDLEDLAKNRGFKVVSLQAPDEKSSLQALSELSPVITRMKVYDEILHFVVVRSVNNGWVYIGDPGYGNVHIPWDQFYSAFNNADRIFVAVSKDVFKAKIDEATGSLALKRADDAQAEEMADAQSKRLFDAAKSSIRFANSL